MDMTAEKKIGVFVAGADTYGGEVYRDYVSQFKTHAATLVRYMEENYPAWSLEPAVQALIGEYQKRGNMKSPEGITVPDSLDYVPEGGEYNCLWLDLRNRLKTWCGINTPGAAEIDAVMTGRAYVFMKWLLETNSEVFGTGLLWPSFFYLPQDLPEDFAAGESLTLNFLEWFEAEFSKAGLMVGLSESDSADLYTGLLVIISGIDSSSLGGELSESALEAAYLDWKESGASIFDIPGMAGYMGDVDDALENLGMDPSFRSTQLTARFTALIWALAKNNIVTVSTTNGCWYFDYVTAAAFLMRSCSITELPVNDWDRAAARANGGASFISNVIPDPYYALVLQLASLFTAVLEEDAKAVLTPDATIKVFPPSMDLILGCCRLHIPPPEETTVAYETEAYSSDETYEYALYDFSTGERTYFGKTLVSLIGLYSSFVGPGAVCGEKVTAGQYELDSALAQSMYSVASGSFSWNAVVTWLKDHQDDLASIKNAAYMVGARLLLQYLYAMDVDIKELHLVDDNDPLEENTMISIEMAAGTDRTINTLASMLETASEDLRRTLSGGSAFVPAKALSTHKLGGYADEYYAMEGHEHPEYLRLDEALTNAEFMYRYTAANFVSILPRVESGSGLEFDVAASGAEDDVWHVFEDGESSWDTGCPAYILIDFLTDRKVQRYSIEAAEPAPATVNLYGSKDGEDWIHLDIREDITWDGETFFYVVNPGMYRYYMTVFGSSSDISIISLDMEEYSGIPEQVGASDLALVGHTHEDEYYRKEDTVENALYLVNPNYAMKSSATTAYGTFAYDSKSYSAYETGEALFSKDSLAQTTHTHPEYLQQGESAYSAEAFYDGVNLYYADAFADFDHEHLSLTTYLEVVPELISNYEPSPFAVTATHDESNAWRAFSSEEGDVWTVVLAGEAADIMIDTGDLRLLNRYSILPDYEYGPFEWEFYGSRDNSEWVLLHEGYRLEAWEEGVPEICTIDVAGPYRYFRFRFITAVSENTIVIEKLQIYSPKYTYLRVGDPAQVAIRVGGKTWRDFALADHNHDDRYYTAAEMDEIFMKRSSLPLDGVVDAARAVNGMKVAAGEISIPAGGMSTIPVNSPVACVLTLIGASPRTSRPKVTLNPDGVQLLEATGETDASVSYMVLYTG